MVVNKTHKCPKCGDTNLIRTACERTVNGKPKRVWETSCDSCGNVIMIEEMK